MRKTNGKGRTRVTLARIKQRPIRVGGADKRELRTQFGALCYRLRGGKVEFLLITSRGAGRWIIPKGWPMDGETPAGAAATEAMEEAGARGKVGDQVLGFYAYSKTHKGDDLPCVVAVFPLEVKKLAKDYPEKSARKRRWVGRKQALALVEEPELRRIIKDFRPKASTAGSGAS
ncbi:MAG TPA: NUDIX hydrolase [Aliiroseovarius sp.]|nr:NUDIX hydrolase [Aliiroseovarius sp.]